MSLLFPLLKASSFLGLLGFLMTLAGLSIAQIRLNESLDLIAYNPYALKWFCLFFFFVTLSIMLVAQFYNTLGQLRHFVLHFTSIAFVFVVLNMEDATQTISRLRDASDRLRTSSILMEIGLVFLSLNFVHWIVCLGSMEWFFGEHKKTRSLKKTQA